MVRKNHKVSSSDTKLITLKLEEKRRLENQNNIDNDREGETKIQKERSTKHLGITLTTIPTIQHTDLLHFIAKKERKVLELREELKRNEEELDLLKKKWETIFIKQINGPEGPINNNNNKDDCKSKERTIFTSTATIINGDCNKKDENGNMDGNENGENENDKNAESDDDEVLKLMNGLGKGIIGVVNGIKNVAESEVTQEKLLKIKTVVADVANYEPVKQTRRMTFDFTSHAFGNITKGISSITQSETVKNARRKTMETVYQLNEVLAPQVPPSSSITSTDSIYTSSPTSASPSTPDFSSSSSSSFSSPSSTTSTTPNSPKTPTQQISLSSTNQIFGVFNLMNSKKIDEITTPSPSPLSTTKTKGNSGNDEYNEEALCILSEIF